MRKTTILTIALLLALPAAMVIAGPAVKAYLSRPADALEGATDRGTIKIKSDKKGGLHLFSVKIKDMAEGTYGVYLVDPDGVEADVEIGSISVAVGEDCGKLKFNTKRGDTLTPDPVGMMVEVRDGENVVLSGPVPDPDAAKLKGNVKAKLDVPDIDPFDADAKGFVRLKVGNGAHHLQVVAQKAAAGTYDVMVENADGEYVDVGDLVIEDGENSGSWMANDKAGDAIPAGAATFAALLGQGIKVQTQGDTPSVLLEGTIPEIKAKNKK